MPVFLFRGYRVKELQLLGTSACHLCELAEGVLSHCLAQGYAWEVEVIDIADDDVLISQWGEQIPVLLDPANGAALCWPFDGAAAIAFVESAA